MRIAAVTILVVLQFTAIPFFAALALRDVATVTVVDAVHPAVTANVTTVYKNS